MRTGGNISDCNSQTPPLLKTKVYQVLFIAFFTQKWDLRIPYDVRVGLIMSIQILNSKRRLFNIFVSTQVNYFLNFQFCIKALIIWGRSSKNVRRS